MQACVLARECGCFVPRSLYLVTTTHVYGQLDMCLDGRRYVADDNLIP